MNQSQKLFMTYESVTKVRYDVRIRHKIQGITYDYSTGKKYDVRIRHKIRGMT